MADAGQMQQVVINMSINARDAMPNGGQLTLELSNATVTPMEALRISEGRPGEFVLLKIVDTGTGMPPEIMQRIFEPFFTTKGPGKGTGLGLATCFGIIKQTSGMLAVASEVGVGTTFSIYLPRAEAAEVQATAETKTETVGGGSETILVVEDEEILRELAVDVLEGFGYRVIAVEDGLEAVKTLQEQAAQIDLVITDLVMPRMSGRELVAWIAEKYGEMRVVFTSGYTDDEIIRHAIEDAKVEYIQKPYTPKALAQKIRQVLDTPDRACAPAASQAA
jgi:CheY-like chemotaxis protein